MSAPDPRLTGLATLLQLEKEARHAESEEAFGFVLVNQTRRLLPYRLAAFWRAGPGGGEVAAVSGVQRPALDAPFMQWLAALLAKVARDDPAILAAKDVEGWLRDDWPGHAPPHAFWLPLKVPGGSAPLGGLWLVRDTPWGEGDRLLGERLADGYGETLARHRVGRSWRGAAIPARRIGTRVAALALLAALGAVPVPLSVLAPAEIVPRDPVVVTAPREGVVGTFHVQPNQPVVEGQPLFGLDETEARSRHEVALKTLAVTEAEHRKASQAAFGDRDSLAERAILLTRIDKARAEAGHAEELLERGRVKAPRAGIAVFGDVNDWIGRPVRVGERILTLADPAQVEILVWLPVADAIVVEPGARIALFLNIAPLDPLPAHLRTASYEAEPNPDRILAYRLKASLDDGTAPPRIGLKGTAKVYGGDVFLAWYLFRRPLAALRQLLGF
ncbi:MAG: HlyD family efflux transporter periplasmic adaptor subunit [Magnetospirillum sp. WYHS-4]